MDSKNYQYIDLIIDVIMIIRDKIMAVTTFDISCDLVSVT